MHLVQLGRKNGLTLEGQPSKRVYFIHSFPIKALGGDISVFYFLFQSSEKEKEKLWLDKGKEPQKKSGISDMQINKK